MRRAKPSLVKTRASRSAMRCCWFSITSGGMAASEGSAAASSKACCAAKGRNLFSTKKSRKARRRSQLRRRTCEMCGPSAQAMRRDSRRCFLTF